MSDITEFLASVRKKSSGRWWWWLTIHGWVASLNWGAESGEDGDGEDDEGLGENDHRDFRFKMFDLGFNG